MATKKKAAKKKKAVKKNNKKKTSAKKTAKKVAKAKKKAVKKKTTKKASKKKVAKKKTTKKKAVKKVGAKKASKKKVAKKKVVKKATKKKASKTKTSKPVKKTTKKAVAKKSTQKKATKKATTKTSTRRTQKAPIAVKSAKVVKASRDQKVDWDQFITPLDDRVVIEREVRHDRTPGGLIIPDVVEQRKNNEGRVVVVGRGHRNKKGKINHLDVSVGDTVVFGPHAGTELELNGCDVVILSEKEILGVKVK